MYCLEAALHSGRHVKASPSPVSKRKLAGNKGRSFAGEGNDEDIVRDMRCADDYCRPDFRAGQVGEGVADQDDVIL